MKKIMKFLLPVVVILVGGAGGYILKGDDAERPHADEAAQHGGHAEEMTPAAGHDDHSAMAKHDDTGHGKSHGKSHGGHSGESGDTSDAWFSFSNQFFVPLMRNSSEDDLMILSLTLQSTVDHIAEIESKESLLRDIVLRQLLIIANTGGFDGNFTTHARYTKLRRDLLEAVQAVVGHKVGDVLIEDIARQTG